MNELLSV